ncbi:metalloprotease [Colletotrichum salicis]|uniref:Metalloprotease n=1 Tax=Colletotrichum salicis TaxID=1209931 RepID=A0A135V606_9PEZI|nr:metalloprotease [Colletotrichum salicis]
MQFKLSVVAALAAAASAHIEISKKLAEEEAANNGTVSLMAAAAINVNVYFHVVASSQTVDNGYITLSNIGTP